MNQYQIKVHLGFLQVRHSYEIVFHFECPENMENLFDLQTRSEPGHVRINELKSVKSVGNQSSPSSVTFLHRVTAHLYADKEKLLKKKICLQSKMQKSQSLTFIFYGRVLGAGKGTPFLKQGIKCIGFELEEEEENSEL